MTALARLHDWLHARFLRLVLWHVNADLAMLADQRRRIAEAEINWQTRRGELERAILVLEAE